MFQEEVLHLVRYLSARDFIYPKIQTKLVILGKAVYQKAFLPFENRLNVDLLLRCLRSLI